MPNQAGTAGTWNFQLHPAFRLGMALCDNQSAPEFTHAPCVPNSDTNMNCHSSSRTSTTFIVLTFLLIVAFPASPSS